MIGDTTGYLIGDPTGYLIGDPTGYLMGDPTGYPTPGHGPGLSTTRGVGEQPAPAGRTGFADVPPVASRPVDVPALVQSARDGSPRAVARLISLVEDEHPALREVMAALAPHAGNAHVVGITG